MSTIPHDIRQIIRTTAKRAFKLGRLDERRRQAELSQGSGESLIPHDDTLTTEQKKLLLYVMAAVQENAHLTGEDPTDLLHELADLAQDPQRLADVLTSGADLSWVAAVSKSGGVKATWDVPGQNRRPLYGKRAERALHGQKARGDKHESLKKAITHSDAVMFGHATADDFRELAVHIPSLTVSQLRGFRAKIGASFNNAKRRDDMAKALLDHAQMRAERLEKGDIDEPEDVDGRADLDLGDGAPDKPAENTVLPEDVDFGMDAMTGQEDEPAPGAHNAYQEAAKNEKEIEAAEQDRKTKAGVGHYIEAQITGQGINGNKTETIKGRIAQTDIDDKGRPMYGIYVTHKDGRQRLKWVGATDKWRKEGEESWNIGELHPEHRGIINENEPASPKPSPIDSTPDEHSAVKDSTKRQLGHVREGYEQGSDVHGGAKDYAARQGRLEGGGNVATPNVAGAKANAKLERWETTQSGLDGKQPWQVPKSDFVTNTTAGLREKDRENTEWLDGWQGNQRIFHRSAVKNALAAGKPVPPEVLKDYPDLAEKYGGKPTPTAPPSDFADDVVAATREIKKQRNLDPWDDIFISDMYNHVKQNPKYTSMPLAEFKQKLLQAHLDNRVSLGRADLAQAVKPDTLRDSHIQHLNGDYHFINVHSTEKRNPPKQPATISDAPAQTPQPGFTGIDANSHEWRDGVQVARQQDESPLTDTFTAPEPEQDNGSTASGSDGAGIRQPIGGRTGGGSVGGTDGAARGGPFRTRIINPRSELTRTHNSELVPERLREHLTPTQQEGVGLGIDAMQRHGGFLLADGPGTGKTRQILATGSHFADQGKKVLIIAPSEVIKPNWDKREMAGSYANDGQAMGLTTSLIKGDEAIAPGKINVTTYENLAAMKDKIDKDTVILFDESHYMKNKDSARHKHGKDAADKAAAVMYATATPGDKPLHLAHLVRAKIFGGIGSKETFERLGMELYDQHIGKGEYRKVWRINPRVGHIEAMRRINGLMDQMTRDGLMVRRELSLDGVQFDPSHATLTPEQKKQISEVQQRVLKDTDDNKAAALMAARNAQEPMKIPHTVNLIKQALAEGRQPVVFLGRVNDVEGDDGDESGSIGTALALKKALIESGVSEADIGELHGAATKTAASKKRAMGDFQAGKKKIMIATIQSGGTGINLDDTTGDKPRTTIMMTPPFSANDMAQAIGRVHRLNTKSGSRIISVLADTDVDEWNAGLLAKKFQTMGAMIGENAVRGMQSIGRPAEAPDDVEATPFDWGESLTAKPPEPIKITGNTYDHKDRLKAAGAKWNGNEWEIDPRKAANIRGLHGVRFSDTPIVSPPPAAASSPAPVVAKPVSTNPADHGFMRNKFDTWSNGQKIPAGKGWVKKSASGKWIGYTHDEATRAIAPKTTSAPPAEPPKPAMDPAHKAAIHAAVKHLASFDDDRAREINGVGFNKMDSEFGGDLATKPELTDRQAEAAHKMIQKYRRQLGEDHPALKAIGANLSHFGLQPNKYDTVLASGKLIPAGMGWTAKVNGEWLAFTDEEALDRVATAETAMDLSHASPPESWKTQTHAMDSGAVVVKRMHPKLPADLGWAETQHPRNDHGEFVAVGLIQNARNNPAIAERVRGQVTDPGERKKLDSLISKPRLQSPTVGANNEKRRAQAITSAEHASNLTASAKHLMLDTIKRYRDQTEPPETTAEDFRNLGSEMHKRIKKHYASQYQMAKRVAIQDHGEASIDSPEWNDVKKAFNTAIRETADPIRDLCIDAADQVSAGDDAPHPGDFFRNNHDDMAKRATELLSHGGESDNAHLSHQNKIWDALESYISKHAKGEKPKVGRYYV